jgi:malonyl-CoA/methylmalonyl-CoA synthetase
MIAYTSGTTGRSKGAMLLHRNLLANAEAIRAAWRWTADDHLLLTLPLFHSHGLMVGAHGTLLAGASAELRRVFDAAGVYDALLTGRFTMFFGVPTMYTRLLREAADRSERPASLRLYVSGSAPLSPQAFREFEREFGQRILERYGMTETGMNLTNPYEGERRPGLPGRSARSRSAAPTYSPGTGGGPRRRPRASTTRAGSGPATSGAWARTGTFGSAAGKRS